MRHEDLFNLAGEVAIRREDRRSFYIGAVGFRSDGARVHAFNHNVEIPTPEAHAERRLLRKLGKNARIVYVARVSLADGGFRIAKPCANCERALRKAGVKKVMYTVGPDEWESMILS